MHETYLARGSSTCFVILLKQANAASQTPMGCIRYHAAATVDSIYFFQLSFQHGLVRTTAKSIVPEYVTIFVDRQPQQTAWVNAGALLLSLARSVVRGPASHGGGVPARVNTLVPAPTAVGMVPSFISRHSSPPFLSPSALGFRCFERKEQSWRGPRADRADRRFLPHNNRAFTTSFFLLLAGPALSTQSAHMPSTC